MTRYLARRVAGTIPILLGVVLVVMLTLELIPGDPVALMIGENAPQDQVNTLRRSLGLDKPLPVRYVAYLGDIVQGDFGRSIRTNRPVLTEIGDAWTKTIQLTIISMLLAVIVGIGLGLISGLRPDGWIDSIVRVVALLGLSMPIFWVGLVLIYLFGFYIRVLPIAGTGSVQHLILPSVTLALPSIALIARMARSSLLEVMREDYIRTARAKGLRDRAIVTRHGLRNAMIPVVTIIGLQFGQLMGGAILTETVFAWPGLGRLIVNAIGTRDYPLLQGAVLLFAVSFVFVNLLVDLTYGWIDPRLTYR